MAESYTKKMVLSFGIVFLCLALANVFGYVMRLMLARSLSLQEYGLLYAVMALFGFVSFAQSLGLSEALVHMVPAMKTTAERKRAFLTALYTQLSVLLLLFLLSILLARWLAAAYFHDARATPIIIIYSMVVLLSPMEMTLISFFQGLGKTAWYGYVTLLRATLLLALVLLALWLGLGLTGVMLAYLLIYLLLPFLYLPMLLRALPDFGTTAVYFDTRLLKRMFLYGAPMMLAATAGIFLTYVDTFFLTLYRSLAEVGLYNIALPTAGFLWFFSGVIYAITFPISSEISAAKTSAVFREGIGRIYLYTFILILPLVVVLLLFPDIIINALFGGQYIAAALTLQILVVGGLFYSFVTLNNAILAGMGDSKAVLRATIVGAVVNVILDVILIPPYGMEGSAVATLVAFLVMLTLTIIDVRRIIRFEVDIYRIALLLVTGVLIGVELHFLRELIVLPLLQKIIAALVCMTITYALLLFVLRVLTREELQLLRRQMR